MKEIIITDSEKFEIVKSFEDMIHRYSYVGFVPDDEDGRLMIGVEPGDLSGQAFDCLGCIWNSAEEQQFVKGTYFFFDTAKELYQWLAEDNS